MKQPYFALFRSKAGQVESLLRRQYLKLAGLRIKPGGYLGRINCKWPRNVRIGADCILEDGTCFHIASPFSADNYVELGDRVFIGESCMFNCATRIFVGNDTKIAANTTIVDIGHGISSHLPINQQPTFGQEITIGDDVWIGTRVIILKGVTIGKGSVIGAGSLVNKSIPDYQIWAGIPARFIRNRT